MCRKTLWSPAGPCCGATAACKYLPRIDWTKYTWLVEHQAAAEHIATNSTEVRTGEIQNNLWLTSSSAIAGWVVPAAEPFDISDDFGTGPDVLFTKRKYWFRDGRWLSEHAGDCVWRIYDLEELWPQNIGVLFADKQISGATGGYGRWNIGAQDFLPEASLQFWEDLTASSGVSTYVSWQDILRYAECSMIPSLTARSDVSSIGGDAMGRLFAFEEAVAVADLSDYPGSVWLYRPTPLQVAASFALSPGLLFGVVNSPDSPLYGQFTIFEGGTFTDGVLMESVWELANGPITDTVGPTWQFVRTSADERLPAAVTLRLVRK